MSREGSLSPSSAEFRFAPVDEPPIVVDVVNETQKVDNPLSFSATLSTSFVAPEELDESTDDLTFPTKERKKSKLKINDDGIKKRKDTATSISNFFHRFTKSDKEDKKIIEEDEEEEEVNRPDKLASPESGEKWFEIGSQTGELPPADSEVDLYEWDPNTLGESIVAHPTDSDQAIIFEEKGMLKLLEQFRNGEMRWLDEPQIAAMCSVKEAHEDVTNTHLRVYEIDLERRKRQKGRDDFSSDSEEEAEIDRLFEQMNAKMTNMHAVLDTVPFYDAGQKKSSVSALDDDFLSF
ncbi:unnamed protein product [Caenorhabditis bovis]|uniref:Uncharacterized protein n=1 Tax=Caenorhabditis bovis TaxID=2654633 RepID=A0A8S1EZ11_9PELO|nr:unnamed protein product [Caenorhabditis bovis]